MTQLHMGKGSRTRLAKSTAQDPRINRKHKGLVNRADSSAVPTNTFASAASSCVVGHLTSGFGGWFTLLRGLPLSDSPIHLPPIKLDMKDAQVCSRTLIMQYHEPNTHMQNGWSYEEEKYSPGCNGFSSLRQLKPVLISPPGTLSS